MALISDSNRSLSHFSFLPREFRFCFAPRLLRKISRIHFNLFDTRKRVRLISQTYEWNQDKFTERKTEKKKIKRRRFIARVNELYWGFRSSYSPRCIECTHFAVDNGKFIGFPQLIFLRFPYTMSIYLSLGSAKWN